MDLRTNYLGLELEHPLIAGASPMSDDLDKLRALEDGGIAAITLYSLFEEQVTQNLVGSGAHTGTYEESFAEAAAEFPEINSHKLGVEAYIDHLERVRAAVSVPIIGSLNGSREGEWVNYATLIESAGVDALELNLYYLATDFETSAAELEDRCVRVVRSVSERIKIPLAVKLSPFFTALPHFAKRLAGAGADSLVCFNRFYQPDIDADELAVKPSLELSHSHELRLRLRWLALLSGRIDAQLSVSGGVHNGIDMAKALMAGADSVQMVSGLLINGPSQIGAVLKELNEWVEEKEFESLDQLRGSLNYLRGPDPEAIERANYMRVLKRFRS